MIEPSRFAARMAEHWSHRLTNVSSPALLETWRRMIVLRYLASRFFRGFESQGPTVDDHSGSARAIYPVKASSIMNLSAQQSCAVSPRRGVAGILRSD